MARPREFKVEDAVGGAMDVFWEHGYEGASLPDLLAGMGLTRGSLYKAFTDKKSLYLVVLERYEQDYVIPAVGMLSGPEIEDGWDRVMALFGNVIADVKKGDRRGCLACSAAAGPASEDTEIADAVHRTLGKLQKGFEVALKASRTHAGLIPPPVGRWPICCHPVCRHAGNGQVTGTCRHAEAKRGIPAVAGLSQHLLQHLTD